MTALNDRNEVAYTACIHPSADRSAGSLFEQENWASVARSVDAQLDDEYLQFADEKSFTYSFGSPDDPPPSTPTAPFYWIDPNGRLVVTVTLEDDGLYWVTRLSWGMRGTRTEMVRWMPQTWSIGESASESLPGVTVTTTCVLVSTVEMSLTSRIGDGSFA